VILLEMVDLRKQFGDIHACDGVNFRQRLVRLLHWLEKARLPPRVAHSSSTRRIKFTERVGAAAATTPQIETDQLSYGKATVCRRISSMHSRAYPKRTLDL
jgi:hypothetical protein